MATDKTKREDTPLAPTPVPLSESLALVNKNALERQKKRNDDRRANEAIKAKNRNAMKGNSGGSRLIGLRGFGEQIT